MTKQKREALEKIHHRNELMQWSLKFLSNILSDPNIDDPQGELPAQSANMLALMEDYTSDTNDMLSKEL